MFNIGDRVVLVDDARLDQYWSGGVTAGTVGTVVPIAGPRAHMSSWQDRYVSVHWDNGVCRDEYPIIASRLALFDLYDPTPEYLFEVGEQVRLVDYSDMPPAFWNAIGVVTKSRVDVGTSRPMIKVRWLVPGLVDGDYYEHRFEKYVPPTFQVGDRVEMLYPSLGSIRANAGDYGTVVGTGFPVGWVGVHWDKSRSTDGDDLALVRQLGHTNVPRFTEGTFLRLVDDHDLPAEFGAIAGAVCDSERGLVKVRWLCNRSDGAVPGHYATSRFEVVEVPTWRVGDRVVMARPHGSDAGRVGTVFLANPTLGVVGVRWDKDLAETCVYPWRLDAWVPQPDEYEQAGMVMWYVVDDDPRRSYCTHDDAPRSETAVEPNYFFAPADLSVPEEWLPTFESLKPGSTYEGVGTGTWTLLTDGMWLCVCYDGTTAKRTADSMKHVVESGAVGYAYTLTRANY